MNFTKFLSRSAIGSAFFGATLMSLVGASDAPQAAVEAEPVKINMKSHAFIQLGEKSAGLAGYDELCSVTPKSCETQKGVDPQLIILDDFTQQIIFRTNLYANADIKGVSDDDNYNNPELWKSPEPVEGKGLLGDCEDYVLHKIGKLEEEGIPRAAMSIVHVITQEGEGHAVLAVHTDKGNLILDNLENELLLPHETGYKFVQIEAEGGWKKASLSDDPGEPYLKPDPIGDLILQQEESKIPIPTWRPDR